MRIEHHVGAHGLGEIVGGIRFGIGVPLGKLITFAGSGRRHHSWMGVPASTTTVVA